MAKDITVKLDNAFLKYIDDKSYSAEIMRFIGENAIAEISYPAGEPCLAYIHNSTSGYTAYDDLVKITGSFYDGGVMKINGHEATVPDVAFYLPDTISTSTCCKHGFKLHTTPLQPEAGKPYDQVTITCSNPDDYRIQTDIITESDDILLIKLDNATIKYIDDKIGNSMYLTDGGITVLSYLNNKNCLTHINYPQEGGSYGYCHDKAVGVTGSFYDNGTIKIDGKDATIEEVASCVPTISQCCGNGFIVHTTPLKQEVGIPYDHVNISCYDPYSPIVD